MNIANLVAGLDWARPILNPPSHHRISCQRLDKVGSCASLTCAIHCALMPFVLTLLPAAFGATLGSEWIEWGLFGCSAAIGATSVHRGRRIHGKRTAQLVCSVGLAMLAIGRIGDERHWGSWVFLALVAGGLVIASAHLINLDLCRTCLACGEESSEKSWLGAIG